MTGRAHARRRPEYGSYAWYQRQLGRHMPGYNPNPVSWTAGQIEEMHDAINRGAHRVYVMDDIGDGWNHKWGFMRVRFSQAVKSGVDDYLPPDDCGGIVGALSYDSADSGYQSVAKVSPAEILHRRALNTTVTSFPNQYAERWQESGGNGHQRVELMLWPSPGSDYTLNGEYDIYPRDLDETHPFGYGGRAMVPVLLASMEAMVKPEYEPQFLAALRAAIRFDLASHQPEIIGSQNNTGRSNWPGSQRANGRFINQDLITYSSGS